MALNEVHAVFKQENQASCYSTLSMASMRPPAFVSPFHLTQKTLDCLRGQSSAISTPALVSLFLSSSTRPKDERNLSSKLFPVHFLYRALREENAKSFASYLETRASKDSFIPSRISS